MAQTSHLEWHGERDQQIIQAAVRKGLKTGAEHLLQASRAVVPLEEATLERSGKASVSESKLRAAVSYDTPYAVYQHERLDLRHDNGRTAKYLERPLLDEQRTLQELIAAQIRKAGL